MINIGIIGAGRIGRVHGESISKFVPNAKVKAIADPFLNDNTIAWAKQLLALLKLIQIIKKILADKDIQAVLICASTDMHSPLSIELFKLVNMFSVKNLLTMMLIKSKKFLMLLMHLVLNIKLVSIVVLTIISVQLTICCRIN